MVVGAGRHDDRSREACGVFGVCARDRFCPACLTGDYPLGNKLGGFIVRDQEPCQVV